MPVAAFFLAGSGDQAALFQSFHESLGIPVHQLDAVTSEDPPLPAGERGQYLAGIGLIHLWASAGKLPINFAAPKEPKVDTGQKRKVGAAVGVAAAILVVVLGILANRLLASQRDRIAELNSDLVSAKAKYTAMAQDIVDVASLKEWEQTSVPWLDEFY